MQASCYYRVRGDATHTQIQTTGDERGALPADHFIPTCKESPQTPVITPSFCWQKSWLYRGKNQVPHQPAYPPTQAPTLGFQKWVTCTSSEEDGSSFLILWGAFGKSGGSSVHSMKNCTPAVYMQFHSELLSSQEV